MRYLGIDPGTTHSGVVVWADDERRVLYADNVENYELRKNFGPLLVQYAPYLCVLETLSPRGMALGNSTFQTLVWVGRFIEVAWRYDVTAKLMTRDEIKRELLGRTNVPSADSKIVQLLKDEVGEKGTKKAPGPTYGVSKHAWQALGAVWAYRQRERETSGIEG